MQKIADASPYVDQRDKQELERIKAELAELGEVPRCAFPRTHAKELGAPSR